MKIIPYTEIESLEGQLEEKQKSYLQQRGWTYTCETPGSYWMWRKHIYWQRYTRDGSTQMEADCLTSMDQAIRIEGRLGFILTKTTHPKIFQSFLDILYDNGGVNRDSPEPVEFIIPECFVEQVDMVELELTNLPEASRDILCTGEEQEQEMTIRDFGVANSHGFLNAFFNNWDTE